MITIEINGHYIDLPPAFKLTRVIEGSYFKTNKVSVARTYPISFDENNPKNQQAMEHANDLRVKSRKKSFEATIRRNGSVVMRGLYVANTIDDMFSGSIVGTQFLEEIKSKKLTDFSYAPDVTLGVSSQDVADYALDYNVADKIGFPETEIVDYYGNDNPDFNGIVNYREDSNGKINTMDFVNEDNDNKYSLLPAFNLLWLLQCISSELGYTIKGDLFEKQNLQTLLLYGSKNLDEKGGTAYKGIGILTGSHIGNKGLVYDSTIGSAWNTTSFLEDRYITPHEGIYSIVLDMDAQMGDAMPQTVQFCKVYLYVNGNSSLSMHKMIGNDLKHINRSWKLDFDTSLQEIWIGIEWEGQTNMGGAAGGFYSGLTVEIKNLQDENLNVYKKSLNYAAHLPDVLAGNLFKEVCNTLNSSITFNEDKKEVYLNSLEARLKTNDFWDITDKVIAKDGKFYQSLEVPEQSGFDLKWDSEINDDHYVIDEGEQEVKMKLCPCKSVNIGRHIWKDEWKANSDLTQSEGDNTILRCGYHDTHNIPMELLLQEGNNTLLNEHLLETHRVLNVATPVVMKVNFTENDLAVIDPDKKLMVDHELFVLDKLTVEDAHSGPGISQLKLWKIS